MRYFVGLDVSLKNTSICITDGDGAVVREAEIETGSATLSAFLKAQNLSYVRIGLESGVMASSLYEGLAAAGLPIVCIDARHAHGVLVARLNKTDRNDARGIAEIMRTGLFKAVHIKSHVSRRIKAMLVARKMLQTRAIDIEGCIGALLREFGIKVRRFDSDRYQDQFDEVFRQAPLLRPIIKPLLEARAALRKQFRRADKAVRAEAFADPVCWRLMTAQGVGPLVALTYRASVDEPARFAHSRTVGAHFGLTPKTHQSGASERRGGISKCGDTDVRKALFSAALVILKPGMKPSSLRTWGLQIAERRGMRKAMIAVARKLAVILHRMWSDGADFCWNADAA